MGKSNNDPLAPSGAGAWGQGSAGFGNKAYGADEYDVVEIEEPAAKTTVKTKGGSTSAPGASVSQRERELARKEAELQKREAELQRREALARAGGTIDPFSIKNFPPCMPIVHHDISMDIPDGKRSIMRQGFMIYLGTVIALVFNFVCVIVAWIETGRSSLLSAFFFALIYMLTGIPLAWFLWYMRLYRAMMKDGALSFGTFFLFFLVHIIFCIYTAISPGLGIGSGYVNYAHTGIITALKLNDAGETLAFIFYIAGFAWWTFIAAVSIFYLFRVYATFRNQGGVQAARQEATIAGVQMVQSDLASGGRNGRGRV